MQRMQKTKFLMKSAAHSCEFRSTNQDRHLLMRLWKPLDSVGLLWMLRYVFFNDDSLVLIEYCYRLQKRLQLRNMRRGGPRMWKGGPRMRKGRPRLNRKQRRMRIGGLRMRIGGLRMQKGGLRQNR